MIRVILPRGSVGHLLDPVDPTRTCCGVVLAARLDEAPRGTPACLLCRRRTPAQRRAWRVRWCHAVAALPRVLHG